MADLVQQAVQVCFQERVFDERLLSTGVVAELRHCSLRSYAVTGAEGHFVPRPIVKCPTIGFRSRAAPLLEEERHLGGAALVADLAHPVDLNRSMPRAAFAANNNPVDAIEADLADGTEERLD